jgi:thiol:disulfide interchange protein DsbC
MAIALRLREAWPALNVADTCGGYFPRMRKTLTTSWWIALGFILVSGPGLAVDNSTSVPPSLKKTLEERYPHVKVVDVQPAPLPGLFEIFTGDSIVYANATGDYLVAGPLMDTREKRNITQERIDERNSIDFASLPLDLAIKTVKGDGRRKLAVFSDPDCPYCKELEESLATFDNVTIYTFLYPLTDIHPEAAAKARSIWCAPNRVQAWSQWMLQGKLASSAESSDAKNCKDDPVDELSALGKKLRVASTPTLFFANGRRVGGTLPTDQLERRLDAAGSAKN